MSASAVTRRGYVDGHDVVPLDRGWVASSAPPGGDVDQIRSGTGLSWLPARVPGTAAAVLADAGLPIGDLDAEDWWFKTTFAATPAEPGEEVALFLDGIATLSDVYLDGELLQSSDSMFERHEIDIGDRLGGKNELLIHCRALGPALRVPRKPRARWRTRVVADGGLRWFRTMLIGRTPGFAPGPPAVGPWRPIWLERRRDVVVEGVHLRPRLEGDDGILGVDPAPGARRPNDRLRRRRGRGSDRDRPGASGGPEQPRGRRRRGHGPDPDGRPLVAAYPRRAHPVRRPCRRRGRRSHGLGRRRAGRLPNVGGGADPGPRHRTRRSRPAHQWRQGLRAWCSVDTGRPDRSGPLAR